MKKTITALCLAAATSWVMTAGAQTQSTTEKAQKNTKSGKTMTYTGCVQEGQTPGTYTLTNVTSNTGSGTSGTSGTTGMSGESSAATGLTFELVATQGVELKEHVGHQVQVTGMMDKKDKDKSGSSGMGTSGSGTGTSGTGSMSGSGMSGQGHNMEHKLRVQSVKMISETCSGQ
jgi:hypothetical protein